MNKPWLSCRAATLLIEKQQEKKLGLRERLQLRWHLTLCEACRRYESQSRVLEKWLQNTSGNLPSIKIEGHDTTALSQKIIRNLEDDRP